MTVSRRRLFQSLAVAGGSSVAEGAEPPSALEALRNVSAAHGTSLTDDRLRVVKPVLENRLPQVRALREFAFDDAVEPPQGILEY
jgi:hypothetical protein